MDFVSDDYRHRALAEDVKRVADRFISNTKTFEAYCEPLAELQGIRSAVCFLVGAESGLYDYVGSQIRLVLAHRKTLAVL